MTKHRYQHEMSDFDHAELLILLNNVQGSVILSGYSSPLYNLALPDWHRIEVRLPRHAAQVGGQTKPMATEVIWLKPGSSQLARENQKGCAL
jgi:DNA adenine methylase